jgi:hypothetical protein
MRNRFKLALTGLAALALIAAPSAAGASTTHVFPGPPLPPLHHARCTSVFAQLGYDGFQETAGGQAITTDVLTFFGQQVTAARHPQGCGLAYLPDSDTASNGKIALLTDASGSPVSPNLAIGAQGGHLAVVPANASSAAQDWVATPSGSGYTWTVGGRRVDVLGNGSVVLVPDTGPATPGEVLTFTPGS